MAKKLSEDEIRDAIEKEQSASIGELSVGPEYWHGLDEGAEKAIPLARQGYVESQQAGAAHDRIALDVLRAISRLEGFGTAVRKNGEWYSLFRDGDLAPNQGLESLLEAIRPYMETEN